jgi:3-deoxy-manno-octulosonate cytidylyltransferase (CMP-KDO synthetase)
MRSGVFDDVVVATDDERIVRVVRENGATACMTLDTHTSGTDRVHEVVAGRPDVTHVVNLQGDEPEIPTDVLKRFVARLKSCADDTLLTCVTDATLEEVGDPSVVKVVMTVDGCALYFSRSPIPFLRSSDGVRLYRHSGIYGFTTVGLNRFCNLPPSMLEQAESLEQLRALENGMRIRCMTAGYRAVGIDTPEDLTRFRHHVDSRREGDGEVP